LPSLKAIFLV